MAMQSTQGRSAILKNRPVVETTLLDLVNTVASTTDDDDEIVAVVASLLIHRRARLMGNFKGAPLEVVLPPEEFGRVA